MGGRGTEARQAREGKSVLKMVTRKHNDDEEKQSTTKNRKKTRKKRM